MTKKKLITIVVLLLLFGINLNAQTKQNNPLSYEQLWAEVKRCDTDRLPKSGLTFAHQLLKKAKREKNFPQTIAASITLAQFESDINPDSTIMKMDSLEKAFQTYTDPSQQSIVHAMLASCYIELQKSQSLKNNKDVLTAFVNKSKYHVTHILDHPESLMQTKAADFAPLITLQEDGEKFNHDLCGTMCEFIYNNFYRERDLFNGTRDYSSIKTELEKQFLHIADLYKEKGMTYAYAFTKLKSFGKTGNLPFARKLLNLIDEVMGDKVAADLGTIYMETYYIEKDNFAKWGHDTNPNIEYDARDHTCIFAQWMQEQMPELKENEYYIQATSTDITSSVSVRSDLIDFLPNKNNALKFRVVNLPSFTYTISDENENVITTHHVTVPETEEITARKKAGLPLKTDVIDSLCLSPGRYTMTLTFDGCEDDEEEDFEVSGLRAVGYPECDEKFPIFVCNAEDGRPVAGATIIYELDKKEHTTKTDKQGMAYLPFSKDGLYYSVALGRDTLTDCSTPRYWSGYSLKKNHDQLYYYINTDRNLYRPGQTVMGKAVVYGRENGKEYPIENQEFRLVYSIDETADTLLIKTNDMGSAAFEFALPKDCQLGTWYIELDDEDKDFNLDGDNVSIEVTEYRLPTFFVSIRPDDGDSITSPARGKDIKIVGQATTMDGLPVQFAKVNYKITKDWRDTVTDEECKTDKDGKFHITYHVEKTDEKRRVNLGISASVTDQKGETQFTSTSINLAEEYELHLIVNDSFDKASNDSVTIFATDIWRRRLPVSGRFFVAKEYKSSKYVLEGEFTSGKSIEALRSLRCGKYYIDAESIDCNGDTTRFRNRSLYVVDSKMPLTSISSLKTKHAISTEVLNDGDCLLTSDYTYNESRPLDLYFSTKETDVYFTCTVYDEHKTLVHTFSGVTDGTMKHIQIRGKKAWGNCSVNFFYVKNGRLSRFFALDFTYRPQKPEIRLAWSTFRNRLTPGQEETWTLSLSDANGKPIANAEVMAELYDKALNYAYSKNVWLTYYHPYRNYYVGFDFNPSYSHSQFRMDIWGKSKTEHKWLTKSFDLFHGFVFDGYTTDKKRISAYDFTPPSVLREVTVGAQKAGVSMKEFAGLSVTTVDQSLQGRIAGLSIVKANAPATAPADDSQVQASGLPAMRTNFSELAFFYPQLRTDRRGETTISFTMPESMTGWVFQALAHTKDMRHTIFFDSAISERLLTIRPNMPRFVRCGDEVTITSTIINVTDSTVSGNAMMKLMRHDGEEVYIEQTSPFTVEPNQTQIVSFTFKVDDGWYAEGVDCVATAVAGAYSDGEKNYLPVLSRRQNVTHSIPYYIMGNDEGSTSLTIDLPEVGIDEGRTLSLEYTDCPAESCIEALKSILIDKENEANDAITLSAKLYAMNRLYELADSLPQLENFIEKSKNQEGNLSLRLAEFQDEDGGISWFTGMKSNEYVTMTVCEYFLKSKGKSSLVAKAMEYIDNEELRYYRHTLKSKNPLRLSDRQLRYLYLSSMMQDRTVSDSVRMMQNAYLDYVSGHIGDLTIYGVANAACALRAFGRTDAADRFVQSLIERTTTAPGQGRFFATDAAYYSWRDYRIPTQVAAMEAIMKTLSPTLPHNGEGDKLQSHPEGLPLHGGDVRKDREGLLLDMQLWLLSQKRVQKWDNTLNTIDVVDLLMKINPQLTLHESKTPIVKYDNEADSALSRKVTITKLTPGISWGAIYLSFDKDISDIQSHSTSELSIRRELFVQSAGSSEWTPYTDDTPLNIGDKVRIHSIIKADRDMDFVRADIQHPACLEPLNQLSGYFWQDSHSCYISRHDTHTELRFDSFRRGTTTHDLDFVVTRSGTYLTGISKVECQFAKMFGGYTDAERVMSYE